MAHNRTASPWRQRLFIAALAGCFLLGAAASSRAQPIPPATATQSEPAVDPFARARHLRHGINLSEWYAQSPNDYSTRRLESYTTPADISLVRQMGFDHVRLSIDARPLACLNGPGAGCDFSRSLDATVDAILREDLAVIIDIHPESEFKRKLASDNQSVESFAALWRNVAIHFAKLDPQRVFFEVLNEPEISDPYKWAGIQQQMVSAIRGVAPRHTIIVAGGQWSDLDDLMMVEPLADNNLVYNFHFYEPHIFTHQGASWSLEYWRHLRRVPYPSTPENVAALAAAQPTESARMHLERYGLERWNRDRIAGEIAIAGNWAKRRHVPLTCNEFGAYRNYSDPGARVAWIQDVRNALENNDIGWTMWDYRGGFGVVTRTGPDSAGGSHAAAPGQTEINREVLRALGLLH